MFAEVTTISGPASNIRPVEKFVPLTSSVRVVDCAPLAGVMLDRVGGGAGTTVKVNVPLVPPGVVTVILRTPSVVVGDMVSLAFKVVVLGKAIDTLLTVIPLPAETLIGPKKLLPVKTMSTVLPRLPDEGDMEVRPGAKGRI